MKMKKVIILFVLVAASFGSYAQLLTGAQAGVSVGYTNQNQVQFEIFAKHSQNYLASYTVGVGILNKKESDIKSTSMNVGFGYVFNSNVYAMAIGGIRLIPNNDPKENYGAELGWYTDKMKVGVQYTKEGQIGAKIGFVLF